MKTIYITAIGLTMLSACNQSKKEATTTENVVEDNRIFVTNEQFEQNGMSLITPTERDFPKVVSVNGSIDVPPENKAVITAIMGGYIRKIPFLLGDAVRKGEPLLYIENQEFVRLQQQFLEVQQQLTYLKSEYERQKSLWGEQISSQKNYLKAQSEYNMALAQHSGLKKQLQLIGINTSSLNFGNISSVVAISSPISGNVSEILVEQGAFVSETTPLIRVIDNQHLHLILNAFERDALYLKKGQKVQFTLPEVSKEQFTATIQLISNNISQDRTVQINAHLDNEKAMNFISGMFAKAEIITETHKAYGLPETAYAESEDGFYALIFNEKTDKGYFFDQVKLPSTNVNQGYIEIDANTDKQFLNNKVFELIE